MFPSAQLTKPKFATGSKIRCISVAHIEEDFAKPVRPTIGNEYTVAKSFHRKAPATGDEQEFINVCEDPAHFDVRDFEAMADVVSDYDRAMSIL